MFLPNHYSYENNCSVKKDIYTALNCIKYSVQNKTITVIFKTNKTIGLGSLFLKRRLKNVRRVSHGKQLIYFN